MNIDNNKKTTNLDEIINAVPSEEVKEKKPYTPRQAKKKTREGKIKIASHVSPKIKELLEEYSPRSQDAFVEEILIDYFKRNNLL